MMYPIFAWYAILCLWTLCCTNIAMKKAKISRPLRHRHVAVKMVPKLQALWLEGDSVQPQKNGGTQKLCLSYYSGHMSKRLFSNEALLLGGGRLQEPKKNCITVLYFFAWLRGEAPLEKTLKFFCDAIAQKILRSGTELRNLSRSSEQRWLWRVEHRPLKPPPNQQWGAINSQPLCPYDNTHGHTTFRDPPPFHQASSLKPGLECSTTANCSFMAIRCCWMGPKLRPAWRCMSSNMLVTWRFFCVFRPGI